MSSTPGQQPVIRFGACEADLRTGEVRLEGGTVRLQDKPLQLLAMLLEKPGELVTREEIRDRIWGPSRFHDFEDSLNQAVRKLREALRDSASSPRFVETIPRRGYRFMIPTERLRHGATVAAGSAAVQPARRRTAVGRQNELQELHNDFAAAAAGRGRVICLSGEPGIGKTTLVDVALSELAAGSRTRVAAGRCSERLAGTEAWLPVLEALENLIRSDDEGLTGQVVKQTAPSWFVHLNPAAANSDASDSALLTALAASQERRKREFVALLEALASEQPLILFLDDVHWADVSTVDLLSYAGNRIGSAAVLIVATYRPSDLLLADHPFLQVKQELQARSVCREIELELLRPDDVRAWIELEFPGNEFPADFAALIFQRTEGSPLFMVDLLRDLRNSGVLAKQNDRWVVARPIAELQNSLPDSVRGMVDRKIGKLSPEHRRLLEAGSVQGFEFHAAVAARVLDADPLAAEEWLDDLHQKHRLVRFTGEHEFPDSSFTLRYAFSHALYQEALYAGLRPTRRAALSAAVGDELLRRHRGAGAEIASQLAPLYEAARDRDRAAEFFTIAAANAGKLQANRQAADLAARALDNAQKLQGEPRERRVLQAALRLADARQGLSQFEQAIADYEFAAASAARLDDREAQATAMCGAASCAGYLKRLDEMRERAQRALEVAGPSSPAGAYAEAVLGFERMFAGDLDAANEYQKRALPLLRERGPSYAAVFAANNTGLLLHFQSDYAGADSVLAWAMERARAEGLYGELLRAMWVLGMAWANQGRISKAVKILSEGMRLAELNGERFWLSRFPNTLGWIHAEMFDFDSAVRFNIDGIRAGQDADTPETEANSHINLAHAYLTAGELDRARTHLHEGERILSHDKHKRWLRWRFNIRLDLGMASYWIAREQPREARTWAEQALSRATKSSAWKHVASARQMLGDIAMLEDDPRRASEFYDAAQMTLGKYPCPLIEWRILRAAATAATRTHNADRAAVLIRQWQAGMAAIASAITDERLRNEFTGSVSASAG